MPYLNYVGIDMRNYGTAICPNCGKEFKRTTNRHRFCTPHCKNVYHMSIYNGLLKEKVEEEKRLNPPPESYELKCRMCGKTFTATSRHKVYCSDACRREANRLSKVQYYERQDLIRLRKANEEGITLARKNSRPTLAKPQFTEGKLWDDNDPECKEVMNYLKTVEPIDWAEIARWEEEERIAKLRAEANEPKTHKGRYVRRNSFIKRCL